MQPTKKKYFFLTLAVGVIILALAVTHQKAPPLKPAAEQATLAQVRQVQLQNVAPEISGFGRVTPKVNWKAIAEVGGKVIYRNPDLEKGRILPAGTLILEIDPLDYELALARIRTELTSSKAELDKLDQEEESLKALLAIEKQRMELSAKELQRQQDMFKKGVLSQSGLDQQRLTELAQKSAVISLKNQLAAIPDSRNVVQAQIEMNKVRVKEATRELANTRITLPVAARVASVDAEVGQAVSAQQQLAELHGIDVMEVEAQVALHDLKTLINTVQTLPAEFFDINKVRLHTLGLKARILVNSADLHVEVPATLERISESIDPNQGTAGVILEVQQNYRELVKKRQTPLANGLFVEARIEGLKQPLLTVPEGALHGQTLYLVNDAGRLNMQDVSVLFRRDGVAAVKGNVKDGDLLVSNDLIPAIPGMQLRYQQNAKTEKEITGEPL